VPRDPTASVASFAAWLTTEFPIEVGRELISQYDQHQPGSLNQVLTTARSWLERLFNRLDIVRVDSESGISVRNPVTSIAPSAGSSWVVMGAVVMLFGLILLGVVGSARRAAEHLRFGRWGGLRLSQPS